MRALALATTMLLIVPAGAMAGDLGGYQPKGSIKDGPAYYAPFGWSGLYVGLQAGYAWGDAKHRFSNGAPAGHSDPDGWVGGGHIGYNMQYGQLVYGFEADLESGDVSGRFRKLSGLGSTGATDLQWQGSARARLGLAADRTLFYATAGWAFADFDFAGGPAAFACCGYSRNVDGLTVGGGIEHMLTHNLTARVEYRYTDFGSATGNLAPTFPAVRMPVDLSTHALRLGVSYKF